ncbi:MAG: cysteine hydrolase family protein [Granulosicoccus sp.]
MSRTALIVIDMQHDFIDNGGFGESLGNDVTPLQGIIPTVAQLLDTCREAGMLVIHTRESHDADLSDCPPAKWRRGDPGLRIGDPGPMGRLLIRGEPGVEILDELRPWPTETVIDKPGKDAFYKTPLDVLLQNQGIESLIICGVTTEVCVQSTMRAANDRGYECLLVTDATESYFPHFKAATIEMIIAQGGIIGWVAESSSLCHVIAEHTR